MSELIHVLRNEELAEFDELMEKTSNNGITTIVIAPNGMGKTSFLESIKNHFHKKDSITCSYHAIRQADTTNFFFDLINSLEAQTHPTKNKIKTFFSEHQTIWKGLVSAAGVVTNTKDFTDILVSSINPKERSNLNTQIQDEFTKMLVEFTKKFPEHKIIILVDDIDSCLEKELFVAMFNDLKKTIPKNVILTIASKEKLIDSDYEITLDNFNYNEISQFMKSNFPNITEEIIEDVSIKSQGFPESLFWLWKTYQRTNQDLKQLLNQLPREGFALAVQKNFLSGLGDEQLAILKICAVSLLFDQLSISKISGIEQLQTSEILQDFDKKGFFDLVNSFTLSDEQIIDIYSIKSIFVKAIKSVYGTQTELKKKVINYAANSIFENTYGSFSSIPFRTILLIHFTPSGPYLPTAEELLNLIDLELGKKCILCLNLIGYFETIFDVEKALEFVDLLPKIAKELPNKKNALVFEGLADLYKQMYSPEMINKQIFKDKEKLSLYSRDSMDNVCKLESLVLEMDDNVGKTLISLYLSQIKFNLSQIVKFSDAKTDEAFGSIMVEQVENYLNSLTQMQLKDPKCLIKNEKCLKFALATHLGSQSLISGNILYAYVCLLKAEEIKESLSDDEKNEIDSTLRRLIPPSTYSATEDDLSYNIDYARLLLIIQANPSDIIEKQEDKEELQEITNNLKKWEHHPLRGQIYKMAKNLLKQNAVS